MAWTKIQNYVFMILKPVYLSHSLVVFKVSGLHYTLKIIVKSKELLFMWGTSIKIMLGIKNEKLRSILCIKSF